MFDAWFSICIVGMIAVVPLHYLSVEHQKLERFGETKGTKVGVLLGMVSGWGFFSFWIGVWVSPQLRFTVSIPVQGSSAMLQLFNTSVSIVHLIISVLLLMPGAWLGIKGVKEITLKVAETHRADRVLTSGVYSVVRHPQYLGGLLSHLGITFLLSALYSLLVTPLIIGLVYLISRKEEEELVREFGKEYEEYRKRVPMLFPRIVPIYSRKIID